MDAVDLREGYTFLVWNRQMPYFEANLAIFLYKSSCPYKAKKCANTDKITEKYKSQMMSAALNESYSTTLAHIEHSLYYRYLSFPKYASSSIYRSKHILILYSYRHPYSIHSVPSYLFVSFICAFKIMSFYSMSK